MPNLLAPCRRRLTHRSSLLLWAWVLFGLVLAGMPRWETHHHALADHDHSHATALGNDDGDPSHDFDEDEHGPDAAVTHAHAVAVFPLAIHHVDLLTSVVVVRGRTVFPPYIASSVASRWPPPHRPPIA